MFLRFTKHARDRMRERGITEEAVYAAIASPDSIQTSIQSDARYIAKKIYLSTSGQMRLLMIIYEYTLEVTLIITVIDTSKIDKYS